MGFNDAPVRIEVHQNKNEMGVVVLRDVIFKVDASYGNFAAV